MHVEFAINFWSLLIGVVTGVSVLCTAILGVIKVVTKVDNGMKFVHRILEEHDQMWKVFPEMHSYYVLTSNKKPNGSGLVDVHQT